MQCKNCQTPLQENNKFCASCGAKIINHRLNFKSVTEEFFATFISWDNKFFKTFIHLLTKPQVVANGYLDGVRKRYMQPFAYMIIILSLYGIYMFFAKDQMAEYIDHMTSQSIDQKKEVFMKSFMDKWMSFITNYFTLFTFMTIPFFAFINKIIFRKNNFIEHNISLLYSYATYSLISIIIGFVGLIFLINLNFLSVLSIILMITYHIYFYKKMYNLDFGDTILKTLLFWIGMFIYLIIFSVLGFVIILILMKLNIIPIPN